jgi:hypothetical protein
MGCAPDASVGAALCRVDSGITGQPCFGVITYRCVCVCVCVCVSRGVVCVCVCGGGVCVGGGAAAVCLCGAARSHRERQTRAHV